MRGLIEWVKGWVITLDLMINNPELYRYLKTETQLMPGDFVEVGPPE